MLAMPKFLPVAGLPMKPPLSLSLPACRHIRRHRFVLSVTTNHRLGARHHDTGHRGFIRIWLGSITP
jgi:hypothetical protein